MSPTPFTIEELPVGTQVFVKGEGYGVVTGHEAETGTVYVEVEPDSGVLVSASLRQITSKMVDAAVVEVLQGFDNRHED